MEEKEKYYKELAEDIEKKYDNVLVSNILPYEAEWEKLSKKERIKAIMILIFLFVCMPILFLSLYIEYMSGIQILKYVMPIFLLICLVFFIIYIFMKITSASKTGIKDFQTKIKKIIMPHICECFPDLKWIEERENHTDLYKKAAVLPNYSEISLNDSFSEISYDDYFEGKYENTDFSIEEIRITISENTNLRKYGGLIIRCSMNKKSKSHTIIHPFIMTNKSPVENLHYTKLEDVIFENNYNVYTDDDVEARYLITPSFMERINNIKTKFNAIKMYAAFYEGNFYLMLLMFQVVDLFEPLRIGYKLDQKENFRKMVGEIFAIYKLIDYFKLTQNIRL